MAIVARSPPPVQNGGGESPRAISSTFTTPIRSTPRDSSFLSSIFLFSTPSSSSSSLKKKKMMMISREKQSSSSETKRMCV